MISVWNLLWIVPLSGCFGFGIAACLMAVKDEKEEG